MAEPNENFKTEEEQEYKITDDVVVMVSGRKVRVLVHDKSVTALCVVLDDGGLYLYDWFGFGD